MKQLLEQLREKAEFDIEAADDFWANDVHTGSLRQATIDGARFQHSKDQALILKLIEIIEEQNDILSASADEGLAPIVVDVLESTEAKLKALVEGK